MRLDAADFVGQLGKLIAGMNGFRAAILQTVASAGIIRTAFGAVTQTMARMEASLQTASALQTLSRRTGESVANLVILQRAFRDAGLGAEMVGPALNMLQRALSGLNEEGQPTNKALARLGLDLAALRSQGPSAQLLALGQALRQVRDPAERAALAMQVFGRGGGQMLAVLSDSGALAQARQSAAALADLFGRNAEAMDRVYDALDAMRSSLRGVFAGLAAQIAPVWERLARGVREFADTLIAGASRWQPALRELFGLMQALLTVLTTSVRWVHEHAAGIWAAAKAVVALAAAWGSIKFAQLIAAMAAKIIAIGRSTAATMADTAATEANTAAHIRNAAARAAGSTTSVAYGPARIRNVLSSLPARGSGAGLAAAAGIGAGLGLVVQQGMLLYIASIEKASAALEEFGSAQLTAYDAARKQAAALGSVEEKQRLLSQIAEQLAAAYALQAEAGRDPEKLATANKLITAWARLESNVKAVADAKLIEAKLNSDYAAQLRKEEADATERLTKLTTELAAAREELARSQQAFSLDQATPAEKLKLIENEERELLKRAGPLDVDTARATPEEISQAMIRKGEAAERAALGGSAVAKATAAEEHARLVADAKKLLELESQRRALAKDISRENKEQREKATELITDLQIAEADARGDIAAAASLRRQRRIAHETERFAALGYAPRTARAAAERMVMAQERIEQRVQTIPPPAPAIPADALARIGGFVGPRGPGAITDHTKRAADLLAKIEAKLPDRRTLPPDDR